MFGLDISGKGIINTTQLLAYINRRIHIKYGIQFIRAMTSSR